MSLIGKLAQLVVQLGVVVGQAFIQAYQQAAASAFVAWGTRSSPFVGTPVSLCVPP